jgi:predicted RNase H-like HicB family nuclease
VYRPGGLVDVSETYTAVYERDGEAWVAQIAEEPRVQSRGPSVAEVRENMRHELSQWLKTDSAELSIVDHFRMPSPIRSVRQEMKETRTDDDRKQMMASMTDSRTAKEWADEMGVSMRDPVTVQLLDELGDREVSIDTFCHTITMVEEMSRLLSNGHDGSSRNGVLNKDD